VEGIASMLLIAPILVLASLVLFAATAIMFSLIRGHMS
jgi:hypothetical protein